MIKKTTENYKFYQNRKCEFFPCHETNDRKNFNCLFCFCPLYCLGENCGGNFKISKDGCKDCSECMIPHKKENYGYICEKFAEISECMCRIQLEDDKLKEEK